MFVSFVQILSSCKLTIHVLCVSLLTFQDCVQLNQYTLKDEIGKVSVLGARLVSTCNGGWGGEPARAGSGRGVLEGKVRGGVL